MPIAGNGDVYDFEEIFPLYDEEENEDFDEFDGDFSQLEDLIDKWETLNSRF